MSHSYSGIACSNQTIWQFNCFKMEQKLTAQLGITPAEAVTALAKYESMVSGVISSSNAAIRENGISKFLKSVSPLMVPFVALENLCKDFSCTSTTELNKKLETLACSTDSDSDEGESIEAYFRIDTEWTKFLQQCDVLLAEDTKEVQGTLATSMNFVDLKVDELTETGTNEVSVKDVLSRSPMTWFKLISAEGCQVVVVACGVELGARRWKEDTPCQLPMLIDLPRSSYKYFGMVRSVARVFGVDTMTYYVNKKFAGGKFLQPYEGVVDDPIQMGGDIIMSRDGDAKLIFLSKSPMDRINISRTLQLLKEKNASK
ncbi:hypothetical protein Ocin01_05002 [Orchesella cincta]|uniref:Uncharacterized protein n=1 Tax=Orchesella cincta TaxID=48709 RepID=A0A1D2N8T1_ORCCI|nr:hypothetical protein Ocin01_05002 [Orchesella cincta]